MTAGRTPWLEPLVDDYLSALSDCLDAVVVDGLRRQAAILVRAVNSSRGTVYSVGNGGSSSTAETFRTDLKGVLGERHAARVFNGWTSHLVVDAVGQHGFEQSTLGLLDRERLSPDDLVVLISASGNSRNLVAVLDACLRRGVPTLICTGNPGGELAKRSLDRLLVTSGDQQLTEDATHAALHLLIMATKAEIDGRPLNRPAMRRLAEEIKADLALDVGWLDDASDAIADAVVQARPIYVMAPEGGTLASAAEHVAHNLMWDMCHDLEAAPPDVRWGISVAHFTGMTNDSPVQGDAMVSLVRHAHPGDLLLLFSHDPHSPVMRGVIDYCEKAAVRLFGSFGTAPVDREINGSVTTGGTDAYRRALRTQLIGHLLLRASRPKVTRRLRNHLDLLEEERQARSPVAPLAARGGMTTSEPIG